MPFVNTAMWQEMIALSLPVTEKVIRPILVYLFLIVLLRIFGKRELAQLNPFDLVVLIMLSNTVQNSIIGADNSVTGGLIGATSLCVFNYVVVRFLFHHRRLDQIVEGQPTVLIQDGVLQRHAMARELITTSELLTIAHRQGFSKLDEIRYCVIEPGGTFSIEAKEPMIAERYQRELLERLDQLQKQVQSLQEAVQSIEVKAAKG